MALPGAPPSRLLLVFVDDGQYLFRRLKPPRPSPPPQWAPPSFSALPCSKLAARLRAAHSDVYRGSCRRAAVRTARCARKTSQKRIAQFVLSAPQNVFYLLVEAVARRGPCHTAIPVCCVCVCAEVPPRTRSTVPQFCLLHGPSRRGGQLTAGGGAPHIALHTTKHARHFSLL